MTKTTVTRIMSDAQITERERLARQVTESGKQLAERINSHKELKSTTSIQAPVTVEKRHLRRRFLRKPLITTTTHTDEMEIIPLTQGTLPFWLTLEDGSLAEEALDGTVRVLHPEELPTIALLELRDCLQLYSCGLP